MTLAFVSATGPDLLRLVALPVFAWVAIRDIKTRRVSSGVWIPLAFLGGVLLLWEAQLARAAGEQVWISEFLVPAAISFGVVVPIAYTFWWFGGFGGADAKALLVLALLFPTFPQYVVGSATLPVATTPIGSFSFTILTNAVLVAILIPIALAIRNAAAGRITPVMFVGWPISWDDVSDHHGQLLETRDGVSRSGLDLDALRMYLRWRGLTLEQLREDPETFRDPVTLPNDPNPPTDGAVDAEVRTDGSLEVDPQAGLAADSDHDDPWGARIFLADIDGSAYGTSPAELREGLEVLSDSDTETVWISPGTPFLVPIFVGLVIAVLYGDLLIGTFL
ncbi:A24 family peptidase C-terminal domain-containing protein [Natronobacterium texcoconense]|uniref:Preflagellin peptidase FlaK n=1 Tax=Natronobacterium texcoconense TaxID=1095778 RepID=A0A1H1I4I7_NATTX|nr:A24 family peptidase C-terminal domain-containing protein [Natronobacterium texcoconense]SDR32266.1 preflagellin peptidase FlaK [Natronobacterium texcoconense]